MQWRPSGTGLADLATAPAITTSGRGIPIPVPIRPTVEAEKTPPYARYDSAPAAISGNNGGAGRRSSSSTDGAGGGDASSHSGGPMNNPPPPDFIDPSDGHIWRAKYCVLEDGVLYFYRNARDGESHEAQVEREQMSLFHHHHPPGPPPLGGRTVLPPGGAAGFTIAPYIGGGSTDDLSRSPAANQPHPLLGHPHKDSFCYEPNVIWEKRVALDCVGEVRSAEIDYGERSFELLAIEAEDDLAATAAAAVDAAAPEGDGNDLESLGSVPPPPNPRVEDRLILRAGSSDEMKEWLFQFHRSLASFMKEIVDLVGCSSGVGGGGANSVGRGGMGIGGMLGSGGGGQVIDFHTSADFFQAVYPEGFPPMGPTIGNRAGSPLPDSGAIFGDAQSVGAQLEMSRSCSPGMGLGIGAGLLLPPHLGGANSHHGSPTGASASLVLSHGHGRSGLHRKRVKGRSRNSSALVSPASTPGGGSSPILSKSLGALGGMGMAALSADRRAAAARRRTRGVIAPIAPMPLGRAPAAVAGTREKEEVGTDVDVDVDVEELALMNIVDRAADAVLSQGLPPMPPLIVAPLPPLPLVGGESGVPPWPDDGEGSWVEPGTGAPSSLQQHTQEALAPALSAEPEKKSEEEVQLPPTPTPEPKPAGLGCLGGGGKYIPPHLRNKQGAAAGGGGGGGKYVPPHLRNKQGGGGGSSKYVPPHLRNSTPNGTGSLPPNDDDDSVPSNQKGVSSSTDAFFDIEDAPKANSGAATPPYPSHSNGFGVGAEEESTEPTRGAEVDTIENNKAKAPVHFNLGGCADPTLAVGTILDPMYIPRKASKVGKVRTEGYGGEGGNGRVTSTSNRHGGMMAQHHATGDKARQLRWEVGAISECGIRSANEDSYLISNDLLGAFADRSLWDPEGGVAVADSEQVETEKKNGGSDVDVVGVRCDHGLFSIFDGHCGNQAARYAAEKLPLFLKDEYDSLSFDESAQDLSPQERAERVLMSAITRLDEEFCILCQDGGREWDCGATALVVILAGNAVVVANLGDSRGVMCKSSESPNVDNDGWDGWDGWTRLDADKDAWHMAQSSTENNPAEEDGRTDSVFWREVVDIHSPARSDERRRIEDAGGWVTTETEIPIKVQLRRMDFCDQDVVDILKRCFSDRIASSREPSELQQQPNKRCSAEPGRLLHISRTCGELAVSRAIGDRDFKAAFNPPSSSSDEGDNIVDTAAGSDLSAGFWECPFLLPFPDGHSQRFEGNLISGTPEIQTLRVGGDGVSQEFLLLACDGLWDVMDADDAVRVTRGLLFDRGWSAKKAAARLAELAIHLGSSDNITVIVVRFFT